MIPYCVLAFLLLSAISIVKDGLFSPTNSDNFLISDCTDFAPGEIVPCKNMEKKPHRISYYNIVFKRLFDEGYISRASKVLSLDNTNGQDVVALKKIGVTDVTGITEMPSAKFIVSGQGISHPFANNTFDFEFFGYNTMFKYWKAFPAHAASEIGRTLKFGGYVAIHVVINDEYSYNSFINLFTCCTLVTSRTIRGLEYSVPSLHELIFQKKMHSRSQKYCIPEIRRKIIGELEPLLAIEQPYSWEGPWGNEKGTLKYLSSMVDLSFKERYIYIDLGANAYNTSIGSWFKEEYPKQNKPFEIYAVEADNAFHAEYKGKDGLTLLPFAAWVRNETLTFHVYKEAPNEGQRWEKMGYIPEKQDTKNDDVMSVFTVEAFDFTEWFLRTVTKRDYVVVKMDVEGAEVKLLKKLREKGGICLIDELFLECHYDRSGDNGSKYKTTLSDCIDIFRKLRKDGCIVHQWW